VGDKTHAQGAIPPRKGRGRLCLKRDGTRAETRLLLSPKRTSPFKSAGASVQSTAGSRGVRISGSNAGYTMCRGSARVLATHSIRQLPLHFPSRASPCAIRFQKHSTHGAGVSWAPEPVWTDAENLTPSNHSARGESLHRLSYPGPLSRWAGHVKQAERS
jgi:hypothetical protein